MTGPLGLGISLWTRPSGTPGPAPTPTPTPDIYGRAYEPSLNPTAPSTLSPTYTFGTQYSVLTTAQLDWATGATSGPYWPNPLLKSAGDLPSDYPVDLMDYYSSDHSTGAGGIAAFAGMRDAGEPTKFLIKNYEDALTAGWFASIATKPATSPLFSESTRQLETPQVIWDADTNLWYCYYQRKTTVLSQRTMIATSTNGLTWSNPATNAIALPYDATKTIGGDHTGYMRVGRNVFADVPYSWIAYSLHGGTVRSVQAMWGANSPAGPWTFITQLSSAGGFMEQVFGEGAAGKWIGLDPRSIRLTRQGYVGLIYASGTGAGGVPVPAKIYEVLLSSDGQKILGGVERLAPIPATFSSFSVYQISIVDDVPNSRRVGFFVGNDSVGDTNTIGMVETALTNPGNSYIPPQGPFRGTATINVNQSLLGVGSLPAGFETASAGAVTAPTYDADGMNIGLTDSTGYRALFSTESLDPQGAPWIDVFVEFQSLNTTENFQFFVGLFAARDTAMNDGVRIANGTGQDTYTFTDSIVQMRAGGVSTSTTLDDACTPMFGTGLGGRRYRYGLRYYPGEDKVCWMQADGENEAAWVDNTGAPPLTTPMFAGLILKSVSGAQNFAIRSIRVRRGPTTNTAYTFTNSEAAAYVAAMTVQPSNARKASIDTLIGNLKADGIWAKLDWFQLLAAHDAQAARINAINPAQIASLVGSPVFTKNRGYTTSSGNSAQTGFDPSTAAKFSQNSAHLGFYINQDNDGANNTPIDSGGTGVFINARGSTGSIRGRINSGSTIDYGTPGTRLGLTGLNRSGASATTAYRNGVSVGSNTVASIPVVSTTIGIGATGAGTSSAQQRYAAEFFGSSLTSGDWAKLKQRLVDEYLTPMGANA